MERARIYRLMLVSKRAPLIAFARRIQVFRSVVVDAVTVGSDPKRSLVSTHPPSPWLLTKGSECMDADSTIHYAFRP